MEKISLRNIFVGYFKTLRNYNTGKAKAEDIVIQLVFPILCGLFAFVLGGATHSSVAISDAVVTGISIVSALLCAAAVMVFQLRAQVGDSSARPVPKRDMRLIDELFSDLLWAIVVGFSVVLATGLASSLPDALRLISAVLDAAGIALLVNFVLVVCMCLKRLERAYGIVKK